MTADRPRTSSEKLAINRLKAAKPLDAEAVEKFLARHEVPVVEGEKCTFLWRGEADEAWVCQRIVGLPDRIPMRRLHGTDLWYLVLELPKGSRVEYQIEIRRGDHYERFNDPLNEKRSHSPMGSSSVWPSGPATRPRTGCSRIPTPGRASCGSSCCAARRSAATRT